MVGAQYDIQLSADTLQVYPKQVHMHAKKQCVEVLSGCQNDPISRWCTSWASVVFQATDLC
jgi:hypothetical protein